MAKDSGVIHKEGNITNSERFLRAITAIVMLVYPMLVETSPLGFLALLPLIAIYPMFTAIVGWDPVQFARDVGELNNNTNLLRAAARIVLVAVGVMMIMTTLTYPGTYIGWYSLSALLAIVPVMIAIIMENPVHVHHVSRTLIGNECKTFLEQPVIAGTASKSVENVVDNEVEQTRRKAA